MKPPVGGLNFLVSYIGHPASCCPYFLTQTYMKMWSFMTSPENMDTVMMKSNAEVN